METSDPRMKPGFEGPVYRGYPMPSPLNPPRLRKPRAQGQERSEIRYARVSIQGQPREVQIREDEFRQQSPGGVRHGDLDRHAGPENHAQPPYQARPGSPGSRGSPEGVMEMPSVAPVARRGSDDNVPTHNDPDNIFPSAVNHNGHIPGLNIPAHNIVPVPGPPVHNRPAHNHPAHNHPAQAHHSVPMPDPMHPGHNVPARNSGHNLPARNGHFPAHHSPVHIHPAQPGQPGHHPAHHPGHNDHPGQPGHYPAHNDHPAHPAHPAHNDHHPVQPGHNPAHHHPPHNGHNGPGSLPTFQNPNPNVTNIPRLPTPTKYKPYEQSRPLPSPPRSARSSHQRQPSEGLSNFLEGSSKPTPKRQYSCEPHSPRAPLQRYSKEPVLSVQEFEKVRMQAQLQPHDPNVMLDLAKKLVDAAAHLAARYTDPNTPSTQLVDPRVEARNRETWTSQAYKITKKLASRSGRADAIFFLASNYSSGGMGLEVDNAQAYELYLKAAKLDHAPSCYRVAVCFDLGVGTRRDTDKSLSWYKKAAQLGDVSSMYKLGMTALHGGLGQASNFAEGFTWLQRAAEKADHRTPHAVHELGLLYERPDLDVVVEVNFRSFRLSRDERHALELFKKAAELDYPPSQCRLARAYEFGELGCEVNPAKSIQWYTCAAQADDSDAQLGLSGWNWTGAEGILRQSDTEAYLWAERAAARGNARAEFALGYYCQVGVGVPVDLERARTWYQLAADKKHPRAPLRVKQVSAMLK